MLALGVKPRLICDLATLTALRTHKTASSLHKHDFISSAGQLEKSIEGQSFVISGSLQVSLIVDCMLEYYFNTQQVARVVSDVPKIVSRQPFAGAACVPLRCNVVSTSSSVIASSGSASSGKSSGNSAFAATRERRAAHRMTLTGDILPCHTASLTCALAAVGRWQASSSSFEGLSGGGYPITAEDLDSAAMSTLAMAAPLPISLVGGGNTSSGLIGPVQGSGKNVNLKNPFRFISQRVEQDYKDEVAPGDCDNSASPTFRIRWFSEDRLLDFSYVCVETSQTIKNEETTAGSATKKVRTSKAGAATTSEIMQHSEGVYYRCLNRLDQVSWRVGESDPLSIKDEIVEYILASNNDTNALHNTLGLVSVDASSFDQTPNDITRIDVGKAYDIYAE